MQCEFFFLRCIFHFRKRGRVSAAELAERLCVKVQLVAVRPEVLRGHHAEVGNLAFERMELRVDLAPEQLIPVPFPEPLEVPPQLARDKRHVAELTPKRLDH